jgi:hypothetical protein
LSSIQDKLAFPDKGFVIKKSSFGLFSTDNSPSGSVLCGLEVVKVFNLGYGES